MGKVGFILIAALMLLNSISGSAQIDSAQIRELDLRLERYFLALEPERTGTKCKELDDIILSTTSPELRRHVALKIYDHYLNSHIMGDEAVAVHLTDRWFATDLIRMQSDEALFDAKMFAEFNRQSLIGMQAPVVTLQTPEGAQVTVGGNSDLYSVLYFYDTGCAKCKLETIVLSDVLNERNYKIRFYAVNIGANAEQWKEWRDGRLDIRAENTEIVHLWDPEVTSDYQMKYGVVKTPRVFLLDKDGEIVGRGLDADALVQLLDIYVGAEAYDEEYVYGDDASNALMKELFATYGESLKPEDVLEVAGMLKERTLDLSDTLNFKYLEGDLLYYLTNRREEAFKEGSLLFINEYILSREDIWSTEDDRLQVVGMADMMKELLSRTPVGSKVPCVRIGGRNLRRLKGISNYIIFHTEGCSYCEAEIAMADSIAALPLNAFSDGVKPNFVKVNVTEIEERNPRLWKRLFDTFDLSTLPMVIETDRRGRIVRRYTTLLK